jgi:putative Mn2+ efflux pump MntP
MNEFISDMTGLAEWIIITWLAYKGLMMIGNSFKKQKQTKEDTWKEIFKDRWDEYNF